MNEVLTYQNEVLLAYLVDKIRDGEDEAKLTLKILLDIEKQSEIEPVLIDKLKNEYDYIV